ncbi:MAG: helix-turn-helix domain-containing protein, partial [bacterium]|nr:helix-turn-helix domain-containing protein [bacterium]
MYLPPATDFITTREAAKLSGYTSDYLARLARSGEIVGRQVGRAWLISVDSLQRYLSAQRGRKIAHARALASTRADEYRAARLSIRPIAQIPTKPICVSGLPCQRHPFASRTLAFTVACAVVTSGALLAHGAFIPELATHTGVLAENVSVGLREMLGDMPSHFIAHIDAVHVEVTRSHIRVVGELAQLSAFVASPVLVSPDFSPAQLAMSLPMANPTTATLQSAATRIVSVQPAFTLGDLAASMRAVAVLVRDPALVMPILEGGYRTIGTRAYAAIHTMLDAYPALIERSGSLSLSLGAATRDGLATVSSVALREGRTLPRTLVHAGLTMGELAISGAHAAIGAYVSTAYGLSAAGPASARVAMALVGGIGEATLHIALATIDSAGDALYVGVSDSRTLAVQGARFLTHAPAIFEDGARLVWNNIGGVVEMSYSLGARLPAASLFAAVTAPTLTTGERAAFFTYTTINNIFDSASRSLASLFAPAPIIVVTPSPSSKDSPSSKISSGPAAQTSAPPMRSGPSAATPKIVYQSPVYTSPTYNTTTVVKGVSLDLLNQSLASLRSDLTSQMVALVQPVASQAATNVTTIQQVNMIQDLSNLIVRNGDFRGGIFDGGTLRGGISVSATTGSFGTLSGGTTTLGPLTAGATTLATTTITGSVGIGTTTPQWPLQIVNDTSPQLTINGTDTSANWSFRSIGGYLFIATSSKATFATSSVSALTVDTNGALTLPAYGGVVGCAQFSTTGLISNTGSACGSGSGTFAFTPETYAGVGVNATSTALWLKATTPFSLIASTTFVTNASSSQLTNSGNTWLTGLANRILSVDANGLVSGTSTPTAAAFFATSTSLASQFPYASTTAVSALTICLTGDSCRTTWPSSGAGVWPFTTTDTNYGVAVQSTTTPLWFKAPVAGNISLMASSTALFVYASTTALSSSALTSGRVTYAGTGGILQDSTNLTFDGTTLTANTLALSNALTVANGGTGVSSVADGNLVYGGVGGTAALVALATSTGGFLTNSYTTGRPVWTATSSLNVALANTTGTLAVNRGGTGLSSYTQGDVLYASGATTLAGTTTANLKTTLGLNLVENTALSTWAGSSNLTTLGTIATGVWNGTDIAVADGGTGASTFGQGWLHSAGGTSALTSSTSPTVLYLVATSTTLASQFPYASTTALSASGLSFLTGGFLSGASSTVTGNATFAGVASAFTPSPRASGATAALLFTGALDTGLTSSTEAPDIQFNIAQTKTHALNVDNATGITLQRSFLLSAPTETFAASSTAGAAVKTITDAATFGITGAPQVGTFAFNTNAYSLLIGTSTNSSLLNASTTNSYGLAVFGNAGATNNYAATFQGGNVGIGTSTPTWLLNPSSATASQLALSAGAGFSQWAFRNAGGLLYLATTTVAGTATSTTAALTVDANGFLGIGTTTPGQALSASGNILGSGTLALTGTTGTTTLATGQGFTIGDSQFVLQQGSGNVGIGTASPAKKLDIAGDIQADSQLQFTGAIGGYAQIQALNDKDLQLQTSGAGNIVFNPNSVEKMRISNAGLVGIGTTTPTWLLNPTSATASQLALSAGAGFSQWAFRNAGGNLYVATTTVAGNATSTLAALTIIGSSGNVGIGTASPSQLLDVVGASSPSLAIFDNSSATVGRGGTLLLQHTNTSGTRISYAGVNASAVSGGVGTEVGDLVLKAMKSGTLTEGARLAGTNAYFAIGMTTAQNTLSLGRTGSNSTTPGMDFFGTISTGDTVNTFNNGRIYGTFDGTTYATSRLTLAYATAANTFTDLLTLKNGNVGIGTTSPATTLSVAGNG